MRFFFASSAGLSSNIPSIANLLNVCRFRYMDKVSFSSETSRNAWTGIVRPLASDQTYVVDGRKEGRCGRPKIMVVAKLIKRSRNAACS
jgi:cellulase/cellobiase CelA1